MTEFFSGIAFMGCFVAVLYFYRFWKKTGDRFFGFFSLAFAIFALNRVALTMLIPNDENAVLIYSLRLLAFILILYAIFDKNRSEKPEKRKPK